MSDMSAPPDQHDADGRFLRSESQLRGWIRTDGSGDFPAEAGRYPTYAPQSCFSSSPYFLLTSSYVGWITSFMSYLPPAIMSE